MLIKKISPKNRENYNDLSQVIENIKKNNMHSYLGAKGYSIYKSCLTPKIIEFIKKELTVKPTLQNSMLKQNHFPFIKSRKKRFTCLVIGE